MLKPARVGVSEEHVKRSPRSAIEETKEGGNRRDREITSSSIVRQSGEGGGCKHVINHSNTAIQSDPLLLKRYVKRGCSYAPSFSFRTAGCRRDPTRRDPRRRGNFFSREIRRVNLSLSTAIPLSRRRFIPDTKIRHWYLMAIASEWSLFVLG